MTVAISQDDWRKVLAEVVGIFFFFFIGIGSIPAAGNVGNLYVAMAHGFALALAISALGHVSGGHFNPAVTIGLLVARKISPLLAVLYILAQLIGGVLACWALTVVIPQGIWQGFQLGTPSLSLNNLANGVVSGVIVETILTFFLVLAVLGTAVDPRAPKIAGFGIGLTVFVGILVGGPLTGGVMNPARAFAPALVSGDWNSDWWVYWVGPILGGLIASLLYMGLFMPKGDEPVITVPQITDAVVEPPASEPGMLKDQ